MCKVSKLVLTMGLAIVAFAAAAAPPMIMTTSRVQYGDLNLESQEGVTQMYSRLTYAATRVCSGHGKGYDVSLKRVDRKCFRDAIANAVSDVNKPQLTAYYHAKTGIKKEQVFSSL